ncbi:hypothetical protein Tco_0131475 [Tanacetum coccineum]
MTTLAEHMIVAGADNRPPMLEKTMHNSWQNRMFLYIKGKEHGRMMLNSILNGPLVYGTIEVDGVTRPKTYKELDKYGYIKNHKKTVKNGQARTQERKSAQKPEAKPRKVKTLVKQLKESQIVVNQSQLPNDKIPKLLF